MIATPLEDLAATDTSHDIRLESCSELEWIVVRTRNSTYEMIVLSGDTGDVMVRGGEFFNEFRQATVAGSILGRTAVKPRTFEFGLKVLWDRDEMVRAIEQEDEDIHRLKSEISSQKDSTYFARMQYGRLIDSVLQQRSERYVAEFLQRLRDVSVASRVNRAIGDKMIMNAAFLVQREQESAFDRRIKEIASHDDKLTFKYTGPWPPYNFVNIRLKLERAGQH